MALSVVLVIITANTPSACTDLRKDGWEFGEYDEEALRCAEIGNRTNKVTLCTWYYDNYMGQYATEACCVCGGGCHDRKNEDGDPFDDGVFGCPTETLQDDELVCTDTEHNGITGNNACCSCGGGCINTYIDTITPWKSAEGKSCYDYELEDPDCTNTTMRGLVDTSGVYSLASACCFCGGGNNRSSDTTSTTSNTLSTASAASTSSTQPSTTTTTFSAAPPSSTTIQSSPPSSTQPSSTTIAQTPPSSTTSTQQSKAADDNSNEALTIALAVGGGVLALFACMVYSKHNQNYSPLNESPNTGTNVVL